ncbi:glutaminyl-peptide cyclotransferase [Sphingomonas sp. RHCKR7]|uniref:glutaminyl-peptide cyclotransferase n=1 Tax=Sphingomonas folli TaxID=2862497 RepID=UPI001C67AC2E|nr:glutaminyl-peptide cyclotransferase [Sphingomonas folli]MBW6528081.1 glutaminyl-peptide cyclotransferase [Sphingomonas folli]
MTRRPVPALLALLVSLAAAAPAAPAPQAASAVAEARPPVVVPTVVARFPHDREAFTEGLIWHGGALYESVGLEGRSDVRRVDLATGKAVKRAAIPPAQFGEGLAAWKDQLVSLTWHDGVAHRWAAATLRPLGTARYSGEGWGLTSDRTALIRSDGSATLTFHDPATLAVRRRLAVTYMGQPVDQLNELEWVDGALLANVWHQPMIVRIDPASGRVTQVIDLRAIVAEVGARDPEAVANGIAWDAAKRRLFVTGKRWPTMFEIRLPR